MIWKESAVSMLKTGRACLAGHRMEIYLIQLLVSLCWLIPIAAELAVRRFLPPAELLKPAVQVGLLAGSILLNRLLVAPAHCGYHAACYRLALSGSGSTAATCEIGSLPDGMVNASVLRLFWREYRHPLLRLRRQLRWDAVRLLAYGAAVFPGLLLLAAGGRETEAPGQFFLGVGGLLLCLVGAFWMYCGLRRLVPAVYLPEKYSTLRGAMVSACRQTRRRKGAVILRAAAMLPVSLLSVCPFVSIRAALDTEYAVFWQGLPSRPDKKASAFHTRTLL